MTRQPGRPWERQPGLEQEFRAPEVIGEGGRGEDGATTPPLRAVPAPGGGRRAAKGVQVGPGVMGSLISNNNQFLLGLQNAAYRQRSFVGLSGGAQSTLLSHQNLLVWGSQPPHPAPWGWQPFSRALAAPRDANAGFY